MHMRRLSDDFMKCLLDGFLSGLRSCVAADADLNLEIREDYFNVYYKGNSLLKLIEKSPTRYKVEIHKRFKEGLDLPSELSDVASTVQFVNAIPQLKDKIAKIAGSSIELEYEQLIIRANNHEMRNNSDYFVVDRQYTLPNRERFDLLGIFWPPPRHRGQEVPLCLIEVKFALNHDIVNLPGQVQGYFDALKPRIVKIAGEVEGVFRQKLELGLYQPDDLIPAMKTLHVSTELDKVQLVVLLVDYNENSTLFQKQVLQTLPCARQIRLMRTGFGMWQQNVLPVGSSVQTAAEEDPRIQ